MGKPIRRKAKKRPSLRQSVRRAKQAIGQQIVEGDVLNFFADPELLRRVFGQPKPPALRRKALQKHLTFLHDRHRFADFKGMGVANRVAIRLELADLYVPLKARIDMPEGETWARDVRCAGRPIPDEDRAALGAHLSQPVLVDELLQRHSGLVILGDPGSGETTFLKHLTVQVATGRHPEKRLPLVAPLSVYANTIATQDIPLAEFIPSHFRNECGVDISEEFDRALKEGAAFVMLDGLDEVKELHLRQTVVRRVEDFFNLHRRPGNKFVLTSRIIGYREVRPTAEDLEECTLEDFNDEDIEAFIRHWTQALERAAQGRSDVAARDAERERTELRDAVHRSDNIHRLAANPLLLTILALMKREGVTLPERRAELYDNCVKTLISSWNRARGLGRPPSRDLDPVQTLKTLAPLALWMHETSLGVGLVKKVELLQYLAGLYLLPKIHPRTKQQATTTELSEAETLAKQFLNDVHEHTGLVLERAAGRYGFIHLTFEEYLAGVGLALRGQEGISPIVEAIRHHLHEPAWREVILLTVGYLGLIQMREETASALVEALLADGSSPIGTAVVLAGDAVQDVGSSGVTEACRAKTAKALGITMVREDRVSPALRAKAGATFGRLGDERRSVVPCSLDDLAQMEFCYVPPESFRMGDGENIHTNDCLKERCFWIARYPVTVAQFAWFEKEGGYRDPRWWAEAKKAGLWKDGKISGYFWSAKENKALPEWRDRPGDSGDPFTVANHPVVDVNWYEALAFCRWLTQRLQPSPDGSSRRKADALDSEIPNPKSQMVKASPRLPSEAEWEKAARGGRKILAHPLRRTVAEGLIAPTELNLADNQQPERTYPWEGDLEPNKANYAKTEIGATSAAGCFPAGASPYGVQELSGNVWEWTRSLWGKDWKKPDPGFGYPYTNDPRRENVKAPKEILRVLRGGSWCSGSPENLSCSFRDGVSPGRRSLASDFVVWWYWAVRLQDDLALYPFSSYPFTLYSLSERSELAIFFLAADLQFPPHSRPSQLRYLLFNSFLRLISFLAGGARWRIVLLCFRPRRHWGGHAGSGAGGRSGCCGAVRGTMTILRTCPVPIATTTIPTIATTTTDFVVWWYWAVRLQGGGTGKSARCGMGAAPVQPEPRGHLNARPTPRSSRGKDAAPTVAGKPCRAESHGRYFRARTSFTITV